MKICVLQADYSTTDVDYKNYDPVRNLKPWLPDAEVDHVLLNKLSTYKQLQDLKKKQYDIYINLCEAYLEWSIPSIDVIQSLELLNLPYSGATLNLYDPPKELMKYVAYCSGVKSPDYIKITDPLQIKDHVHKLTYPLFVKPAKAGDSLGINDRSRVNNEQELVDQVCEVLQEFDEVLIEEYIEGREFTVLVVADPKGKGQCITFKPIEYIFPQGKSYKTYSLKTSDLHTDANIPCEDIKLDRLLRKSASAIFNGFEGKGYARMDFRVNNKNEIYFLEVNFACSVFYTEGMEGSADYILLNDPLGHKGFLKLIIEEGIERHKQKQKKYELRKSPRSGYGIFATELIKKNSVIFKGEERSQRLVSKTFVDKNWSKENQKLFRQYAYPVGEEVYIYWDGNPSEWAPQNHSCNPNTVYKGLDVIAKRDIKPNEELTLDYAYLIDDTAESFICQCGSENCKGMVAGYKKIEELIDSELKTK
ncbi:MAG TPA: SET domain-containing protein-lysine N-methyltransferase [Saprospiraceae bacterium]|nr:SET domain-containing protein-lysine N-methyltransferase [Saprospiraceae bacterium]